jgi:hypothetical protein
MANVCVDQHSVSNVAQGAGPCCTALRQHGGAPTPGLRLAAVNRKGKCFVCEVERSTAKKYASNPGTAPLVFKHGKSLGLCPTTTHGCCALLAAS